MILSTTSVETMGQGGGNIHAADTQSNNLISFC